MYWQSFQIRPIPARKRCFLHFSIKAVQNQIVTHQSVIAEQMMQSYDWECLCPKKERHISTVYGCRYDFHSRAITIDFFVQLPYEENLHFMSFPSLVPFIKDESSGKKRKLHCDRRLEEASTIKSKMINFISAMNLSQHPLSSELIFSLTIGKHLKTQ